MRVMHVSLMALSLLGMGTGSAAFSAETSLFAPTCGVTPSCDTAPRIGTKKGFLTAKPKGDAWHFGKDFYLNEMEDQWVIAKFQYGNYLLRKNLVHEEVEVQVLRDCAATWTTIGKVFTTDKGEHPDVLRYEDEGGMVFFKIPEEQRLGLGRHRIRLVVSGDQTATELFLEVLPQGATLFVSDVDGTLTTSEVIEAAAGVVGAVPPAHPGAAQLLTGLTRKGYRPIYLTARSSNLVQRTREFITTKKFPAGVVQTSQATTFGLSGDKGIAYKTAALQAYEERGFNIAYAFGNSKVDATAFANVAIPDSRKFFFKFEDFDNFGGGSLVENYGDLPAVENAVNLCE